MECRFSVLGLFERNIIALATNLIHLIELLDSSEMEETH